MKRKGDEAMKGRHFRTVRFHGLELSTIQHETDGGCLGIELIFYSRQEHCMLL